MTEGDFFVRGMRWIKVRAGFASLWLDYFPCRGASDKWERFLMRYWPFFFNYASPLFFSLVFTESLTVRDFTPQYSWNTAYKL